MDGGDVAFFLKLVIGTFLLYPSGSFVLMLCGILVRRRHPRAAWSCVIVGFATLLIFSLPVVANAIAGIEERTFPPFDASKDLVTRDGVRTAIVVLGGGMQMGAIDYGGETVNQTTLARLRATARLQAATGLSILVSGGRPPDGRTSEADRMTDVLVNDFHVPVRWQESGSLDTADNARLSAPLLKADGYRRILLVTDVSHMRRARALFEKAGLAVIPVPTDYYAQAPLGFWVFLPQASAIRRSSWAMHEWVGYLWALLRRQAAWP